MNKMKLGRYIPGDSLIHNLDPRTKLLGVLAIIIAVLVDDSWPVMVMNTILILVIFYLAKIALHSVLQGIKWLWLLFIVTFVFQAIFVAGNPVFKFGPVVFTDEGVYLGIVTFLRFLILYLCSTILTMTTTPMKMAGGLESLLAPLRHIGLPVNKFAMLVTISLRFIPTILEEGEMITRAQKSRGAPLNSTSKTIRMKALLAVLVPLLVGSLQRATDLATAMESRCYTGGDSYSRVKNLHFNWKDIWALILIIIISILPLTYFPYKFY